MHSRTARRTASPLVAASVLTIGLVFEVGFSPRAFAAESPTESAEAASASAPPAASVAPRPREAPRASLHLEARDPRAHFEVLGARGLVDTCDGACTLVEPLGSYRVRLLRGRHFEGETSIDLQHDTTVHARPQRKAVLGMGIAGMVVGTLGIIWGAAAIAEAGDCGVTCLGADTQARRTAGRWIGASVLGFGTLLTAGGVVLVAIAPASIHVDRGVKTSTRPSSVWVGVVPTVGGGALALSGSF